MRADKRKKIDLYLHYALSNSLRYPFQYYDRILVNFQFDRFASSHPKLSNLSRIVLHDLKLLSGETSSCITKSSETDQHLMLLNLHSRLTHSAWSTGFDNRPRGTQASAGVRSHETIAKMVTIAKIIGASTNSISAKQILENIRNQNSQFSVEASTGNE